MSDASANDSDDRAAEAASSDLTQSTPDSSLAGVLWIVITVSLTVHVACLVLGNTLLSAWRCPHEPVHAAVEMCGGFIAILVAWMLLSLERRNAGTSFNVWIAGALIGMGLLDALHSLVHAGQAFVWLHSTATFAGGLLFACVWLPATWHRKAASWWPWTVAVSTLLFGCLSLVFPDSTPAMLHEATNGEKVFSGWAKTLNISGGVLLFIAAVQLVRSYFQTRNTDDLLFCLHCALFGAAAIMFEQSRLWDLAWWGWHILRLLAYGVALWFVVLTERRAQQDILSMTDQLRQWNSELETRVRFRTNELAETNAALEQSNLDLQQFAYVASHDLQTPLRAVAGFAQFLKEDYSDTLDEEGNEYIRQIVAAAFRMQNLIQDLLAYSRVETRAKPFEPVRLNDIVDEVTGMLSAEPEHRAARITRGSLPTVDGDETQLRQLFQNLIGNGLKYCTTNPEIRVAAEQIRDEWLISVSDNGIGIAEKQRERIFDIFSRLHTEREYPGTGIGLSICRKVVQRHGGRIWVESADESGSRFCFTVPCLSNVTPETEDGKTSNYETD